MNRIEHIVLHRLQIPLRVPYVLAIGTKRALDTVLVEAHDEQGRIGYGDATVLTGYTHETIDGTWSRIQALWRCSREWRSIILKRVRFRLWV